MVQRTRIKTLIKTKLIDPTHIEVRDYEMGVDLKLIHCLEEDYRHCFHIGENFMILTRSAQKKGKVVNTQMSKFYPYKYYKIYKFLWKPTGQVEGKQIQDKKITYIGNRAIIE